MSRNYSRHQAVNHLDEVDIDEYSAHDEVKNTEYAVNADDEGRDGINENTEAHLLPCESEKKYILSMFEKLRKDNHFCDVTFQCHSSQFHAHRVIVSSWSRWLRALLCESTTKGGVGVGGGGDGDNVLTLDFFDASALGCVLDYMYGVPLMINVDNADAILKVVRRLELQKLEQQCWRYLMTIINPHTNCERLHELADRYDCPPLKLACWRILQETIPGYATSPFLSQMLRNRLSGDQVGQYRADLYDMVGATGFTGPGEVMCSVKEKRLDNDEEGMYMDDEGAYPSVFEVVVDDDTDEDEDDDDYDEYEGGHSKPRGASSRGGKCLDPSTLDGNTSAVDVIRAWSHRLKDVYDACTALEAVEYEDQDSFKIQPNSSNIRLRNRPTHMRNRPTRNNYHDTTPINNRYNDDGGGDINDDNNYGNINMGNTSSPPLPSTAGRSTRKPPLPMGPIVNNKSNNTYSNNNNNLFDGSDDHDHDHERGGDINMNNGSSFNKVNWFDELKRFYVAIQKPEKISGIKMILEAWTGREDEMLQSLIDKYQDDIPNYMHVHLEQIYNKIETGTESSFVKSPNSKPSQLNRKKNATPNSSSVDRGTKSVGIDSERKVNKVKASRARDGNL